MRLGISDPINGIPDAGKRLRARLGARSVCTLSVRGEHRPERAWQACDGLHEIVDRQLAMPASSQSYFRSSPALTIAHGEEGQGRPATLALPLRPIFLLPDPRRLVVRDGRPIMNGRLLLHTDSERIENGWWDEADIARDYYAAVNAKGESYWVFRDLRTHQWYLHGIFA